MLYVARVDRRITSWMGLQQAGVTAVLIACAAGSADARRRYVQQMLELGYLPLILCALEAMPVMNESAQVFT